MLLYLYVKSYKRKYINILLYAYFFCFLIYIYSYLYYSIKE